MYYFKAYDISVDISLVDINLIDKTFQFHAKSNAYTGWLNGQITMFNKFRYLASTRYLTGFISLVIENDRSMTKSAKNQLALTKRR